MTRTMRTAATTTASEDITNVRLLLVLPRVQIVERITWQSLSTHTRPHTIATYRGRPELTIIMESSVQAPLLQHTRPIFPTSGHNRMDATHWDTQLF